MRDGSGPPLDRLLAWSAGQAAVRAVVLMGSQARTEMPADEWSDIDVLVVTEDPGLLLGTQRWASEAFGVLVLSFTEPTPLAGLRERRVLLPDGTDLDVIPVPVAAMQQLFGSDEALGVLALGHRVLLDKDGLFAELPARLGALPPPAPTWPPSRGEVADLAADFWHHCVWITKRLRRGELFRAHGSLVGHHRYILLRFAEWQALARSDGAARVWFDGRFLEEWAAPETVAALTEASAGYERRAVARAVVAAMRCFGPLSAEVLVAVGGEYPDDGDRWVTAWVTDQLRDLT